MARLLREQGYTATSRAQLLAESGVSNGSLYHHFPGGMEALAEAALEASGAVVADALRESLDAAPNAGEGVVRFLDIAWGAGTKCAGCPIAPTALESPIISPRLRAVAGRCFDEQEAVIADRLRGRRMARPFRLGGGLGGARSHRGRTAAWSRERATKSPRARQARQHSPYSPATRGPRDSNPNTW